MNHVYEPVLNCQWLSVNYEEAFIIIKKSSSKAAFLADVRKPSISQPGGVSVPSCSGKYLAQCAIYGLLFTPAAAADTRVSLPKFFTRRGTQVKTPDPSPPQPQLGEKAPRSIFSDLFFCIIY